MAVRQLYTHHEMYAQFVPEDFEGYCKKMWKDGSWGDHLTLQAIADKVSDLPLLSLSLSALLLSLFSPLCHPPCTLT
jgi:hypothetical protein